jgi:hypothetical protein
MSIRLKKAQELMKEYPSLYAQAQNPLIRRPTQTITPQTKITQVSGVRSFWDFLPDVRSVIRIETDNIRTLSLEPKGEYWGLNSYNFPVNAPSLYHYDDDPDRRRISAIPSISADLLLNYNSGSILGTNITNAIKSFADGYLDAKRFGGMENYWPIENPNLFLDPSRYELSSNMTLLNIEYPENFYNVYMHGWLFNSMPSPSTQYPFMGIYYSENLKNINNEDYIPFGGVYRMDQHYHDIGGSSVGSPMSKITINDSSKDAFIHIITIIPATRSRDVVRGQAVVKELPTRLHVSFLWITTNDKYPFPKIAEIKAKLSITNK